jgi:hypothetical protein
MGLGHEGSISRLRQAFAPDQADSRRRRAAKVSTAIPACDFRRISASRAMVLLPVEDVAVDDSGVPATRMPVFVNLSGANIV